MEVADTSKAVARWKQYHSRPELWFSDFFGDRLKLTNQQMEACIELGKLISAKMKFADGKDLTKEEEIYARKMGVSIMAGKGVGKDLFAAAIMCYFLCVFNDPHVMGTANTSKQLKNVLWREISKIMSLSSPADPQNPHGQTILQNLLEWQSEKLLWKEKKGHSWFAEGVTISPHATSDEQAKALTGRHAEFMLIVVDEAMGVPEPALMALEGTLTGKLNIILMIFNPFRSSGYAIDSQYKDKGKWVALRWNAENTVFPDESMNRAITARNELILEKYGKESNPYRIQVSGLPPVMDANTLIPWDWIMDAIDREIIPGETDPVLLGVDPAAGGDKSVIARRKGGKVYPFVRFRLADTMEFTGKVIQEAVNHDAESIFVDPIGVGKGVYDRLKEQGYKTISVDVRRTPRDIDRFDKLRDELWWTLRKQFEAGTISIPNDQDLIDQLGTVKSAQATSAGKEKIVSKNDMRKEMGQSPDEADALCLTYLYDDVQLMRKNKPKTYSPPVFSGENSWMGM